MKKKRKKKEKEDQSTGMRSFFRSHGENYRSGWITMEKPSTSTTWAHVTDCMHISFVCLFFISVSFIFEDQWKSMNNQSSSFWSFREFLALCTHTQIHTQAHTHAQSCTHSFSQQSILCAITFGHWNRSASMETYGERNQETLVLLAHLNVFGRWFKWLIHLHIMIKKTARKEKKVTPIPHTRHLQRSKNKAMPTFVTADSTHLLVNNRL